MKKILSVGLAALCALMLMPLSVLGKEKTVQTTSIISGVEKVEVTPSESFIVCNTQTGENTEFSAEDYIFGVVAAEMPALYDAEALKAQAVAAYTYACYKKAENNEKNYDITNDSATDQSFITKEQARERWGENADIYEEKIRSAVKETLGYMITYNSVPILSLYHAISSGRTESAENVWGTDYDYLVSVDSSVDKLSPDYISVKTISAEDLASALSVITNATGDASQYFTDITVTDSLTVKDITYCGEKTTGSRIRSLLDLRSTCFEVSYQEGVFTFTVYGYGHGVGMSQFGADYMAKQGSNYKEILTSYYKGCEVIKVKK